MLGFQGTKGAKSAKLEGFIFCLTDDNVGGPIPVVEASNLGLPNKIVSRSFLQCDQLLFSLLF